MEELARHADHAPVGAVPEDEGHNEVQRGETDGTALQQVCGVEGAVRGRGACCPASSSGRGRGAGEATWRGAAPFETSTSAPGAKRERQLQTWRPLRGCTPTNQSAPVRGRATGTAAPLGASGAAAGLALRPAGRAASSQGRGSRRRTAWRSRWWSEWRRRRW
jgi:hypothetical protein